MASIFGELSKEDYFANVLQTEAFVSEGSDLNDDYTFYGGLAGTAFFELELYKSTGDEKYLKKAIAYADEIISNWNGGAVIGTYHDYPLSEWGLILGRSGVGFVLGKLGEITGEARFKEFALDIANSIVNVAIPTDNGLKWSGKLGIVYDAGIILYLLYAYKISGDEQYKKVAIEGGNELLSRAIEVGDTVRFETIDPGIGLPEGSEAPNFYYGTAGNAYALAVLYEESGEEKFLNVAKKGAAYLENIADADSAKAALPMFYPSNGARTPHYVGICNGYAGSVRLYYKLFEITKDAHYKEYIDKLTDGIVALGAPENHFLGYWNTASICCGTAALLNAFLGIYAGTKDKKYLDLSLRTGKCLIGNSDSNNGKTKWYQAYMRLDPTAIDARGGYFDGAAGIAAQLLHLSEALDGRVDVIRHLDEPYL